MTVEDDTGHSIFSRVAATRPRMRTWSSGNGLALPVEGHVWQPPLNGAADEDREPAEVIGQVSTLERRFPRVAALLLRVWGRPEAARAFRALILDDNGNVRRWPAPVWDELVLLRSLHNRLHGAGQPPDPAWSLVDPDRFSVLEVGYRHVVDRLLQSWGDREAFAAVFDDLIIDTRGDRSGWPAEVWSELVFLQRLHDCAYGRRTLLSDKTDYVG